MKNFKDLPKKKVSQMTPAEKQADAERRKEYNAYQKSKRNEGIEEAIVRPPGWKPLKPRATATRDSKGKAMPEFDYKNRKGPANLHPSQYEKGAIAKAADANPMSANAKAVARTAAAQAAWAAEKAKMKESVEIEESLRKDIAQLASKFPKGTKVKVNNAKKYDALAKNTVSGEVLGQGKDFLIVAVGSGQMNVNVKDVVKEEIELDEGVEMYTMAKGAYTRKVDGATADQMKKQGWKLVAKESVEIEESTDAYAATMAKMAADKQLKGLTKSDRDTLSKLAAMMAKEKKPMKEAKMKMVDPADMDDEEASDDDRKAADKNVIMQIRKGADMPRGTVVTFKDGKTQNFPQKACKLVSAKYDSFKKPAARKLFQDEINKSMADLKKAMTMKESTSADLLAVVEALSPAVNNSYIGMPDADLRRKRNAFLDQINDLIKFKKKNKGDKEVVDLEDKVRKINYAMSHKAK